MATAVKTTVTELPKSRVRVEAECSLEWITLREKKGAGRGG